MDQYEVLDQTWKGSLALHSRYVSKVARDMTLPLLCSGISGHEKYRFVLVHLVGHHFLVI